MTARRVAISRDSARVLLMKGGNPSLPFVGRTATTEVNAAAWTGYERRPNPVLRWWTVDELRETTETIVPEQLAEVIEAVLSGDYPAETIEPVPIHVGG